MEKHPGMVQVADLFIPNLQKDNLVEQLQQFLGEAPHPGFDYAFPPVTASRTTRLNLKITDGCFESCAFCIIPARRGTVRSLPQDEVLRRLRQAHELGYKEAILTGVHLGAYGHEQGIHGLDQLLEAINQETLIPSVRLSSIDPHEITPRMINALAQSPHIHPYLHLPIQSGSDTILERMRRRDQRAQILETIQALKAAIPDISLTTDMIVGFPDESDQDFEDSYTLMQELGIHKIHVFPFSVRPGTRAAYMKDLVAPEIKHARVERMLDLSLEQEQHWLNQWVGQTVNVLVERVTPDGIAKGYTSHYLRVHVNGCQPEHWNQFLPVRIQAIDSEQKVALAELL